MAGSGNSQRRRAAVVAFLIANNITDAEGLDLSHPVFKDMPVAELGECLAAACRASSSASEPLVRRMMGGGDLWSLSAPGEWRPISELRNHEIVAKQLWSNVVLQHDNTIKIAFVSSSRIHDGATYHAVLIQNAADQTPGELFLVRVSLPSVLEIRRGDPAAFGTGERKAYSANLPNSVATRMISAMSTLPIVPVAEPFISIFRTYQL